MNPITLFLVLTILQAERYIAAASRQAATFTLAYERVAGSNSITLRCQYSNDAVNPQAQYFLNGTRVDLVRGFVDTSRDSGTVVFQITRILEGEYSCGTEQQRSASVSFVALPDLTLIPPRPPTYALIGETVTLHCGIEPGVLSGLYFAKWFNGTDRQTLYTYPSPSQRRANPSLETSGSPRYTINRGDLSLTIRNVQLSDSLDSYRCELGVEDPRSPGGTTHTYELTRTYNIGLKVVAPPRIVSNFLPNVVIAEGQETSFKCVAEGYPSPTISWQLNGRDIENGDNPHFEVNSTISGRANGLRVRTVTSYLKTRSASNSVSGEVKCTANPPPLNTDMIRPDSSCMSTQLSVLGYFDDLEIEITRGGDVIVIIVLPRPLPVPVQLVLVYRDADNPSARPDRKTPRAAYTSTAEIRHIEFASQVQFEHFTLEVGLISEGVHGPLVMAQGEFDKNRPTGPMETLSMTSIIVLGAVPGTVCLVLMVVVGLGCCIFHKQTLDYKVKVLMAKNPSKYVTQMREHLLERDEVDFSTQAQLLELVKTGIPQLDPNRKKKVVTYGTQTSQAYDPSTQCLTDRQSLHVQVDGHTTEEGDDTPDCPELDGGGSELFQPNHPHESTNGILLAPPSYEAATSRDESTAALEPDLMKLLLNFVSDSVRATLHQDHDPELAEHVEREVKGHVYLRQKSVEENRIKLLQSQNPGTAI